MTEPANQQTIVMPGQEPASEEPHQNEQTRDAVEHPAKVMRIATMVRQLLDELRHAPLDEASRARLKKIYEASLEELSEVLSDDLKEELATLSIAFDDEGAPSEAELRIAHAQLVGWLEGLFHGIQAMLFAQQMEGRAQLEELRRRSLPAPGQRPGSGSDSGGTYL
ncbi:MAG: hypothetical protein QOH26_51 [Actinomycetota bacterium]|jgi:hypothetical protein|nr:hypothetical protein [Actinomycetota bacterium]